MTDSKLAIELQAISQELDDILAGERDKDFAAIYKLLQSVKAAKSEGRWRNTRFNIFDVLGRPRLEQAHSSFLAWLLDPAEAHGLADAFLREFMRQSVGEKLPSLSNVSVQREYPCGNRCADIHVKGKGWCLIVENKVDDSPWPDQCHDYQEYCKKLTDRGERAWLVSSRAPRAGHP